MPEKPREPEPFRPEESPIAWFGEMLLALDRGDFRRVAESQHELSRLGWSVTRRNPRRKPHEPRREADGRGGGR